MAEDQLAGCVDLAHHAANPFFPINFHSTTLSEPSGILAVPKVFVPWNLVDSENESNHLSTGELDRDRDGPISCTVIVVRFN